MIVDESFRHLFEALITGEWADIHIQCNGKTWRAHRVVLCSQSSHFKKICSAPEFECDIPISLTEDPDIDEVQVRLLLRFMYTFKYCSFVERSRPSSDNGEATSDEYLSRSDKPFATSSNFWEGLRAIAARAEAQRTTSKTQNLKTPADFFADLSLSDTSPTTPDFSSHQDTNTSPGGSRTPSERAESPPSGSPLPPYKFDDRDPHPFKRRKTKHPKSCVDYQGRDILVQTHAQMYANGIRYGVNGLCDYAKEMYQKTLDELSLESSYREFLDSLEIVYSRIPGSNREIRDIAVKYFSKNRNFFVGEGVPEDRKVELRDVVMENPDFALDVFGWM